MSQRKYTHIKILEPEIVEMKESGKTKRGIEEHFGLTIEQIKELLKRYHRREQKIAAGIKLRPKRRPRKDVSPRNIEAEQVYYFCAKDCNQRTTFPVHIPVHLSQR